jgi:hypothetical protein
MMLAACLVTLTCLECGHGNWIDWAMQFFSIDVDVEWVLVWVLNWHDVWHAILSGNWVSITPHAALNSRHKHTRSNTQHRDLSLISYVLKLER